MPLFEALAYIPLIAIAGFVWLFVMAPVLDSGEPVHIAAAVLGTGVLLYVLA